MTPGTQTRHKARMDAFALFDTVPYGSRIVVVVIAKELTGPRRREILPKSVANFLKEREDFVPHGNGVWERITPKEQESVTA